MFQGAGSKLYAFGKSLICTIVEIGNAFGWMTLPSSSRFQDRDHIGDCKVVSLN